MSLHKELAGWRVEKKVCSPSSIYRMEMYMCVCACACMCVCVYKIVGNVITLPKVHDINYKSCKMSNKSQFDMGQFKTLKTKSKLYFYCIQRICSSLLKSYVTFHESKRLENRMREVAKYWGVKI